MSAAEIAPDGIYLPAEVAERWRCSAETVYRLVRSERLGHFWAGGIRIRESDIRRYEEARHGA